MDDLRQVFRLRLVGPFGGFARDFEFGRASAFGHVDGHAQKALQVALGRAHRGHRQRDIEHAAVPVQDAPVAHLVAAAAGLDEQHFDAGREFGGVVPGQQRQ